VVALNRGETVLTVSQIAKTLQTRKRTIGDAVFLKSLSYWSNAMDSNGARKKTVETVFLSGFVASPG